MITGEARVEWKRVVKLLIEAETISRLDRAALSIYCQAWARWNDAERKILETGGPVVKSPAGYPMQNPFCTIASQAAKQMHAMIRELGLSPSARKKNHFKKKNATKQPADLSDIFPMRSSSHA
jgi:P27 family predicted phage terminase small subunit